MSSLRDRLLIGERGNKVGLWLSRPGKSVFSNDPDDFLISSSDAFSNISFLDHIFVHLRQRGSHRVEYGTSFAPLTPLVFAQTCKGERNLVPSLQTGMGIEDALDRPPRWRIHMFPNGCDVNNLVKIPFDIQALVLGVDVP